MRRSDEDTVKEKGEKMMSKSRGKRRVKSVAELATVRIGKKGVTDSFIMEVSKNLDKRGEVRVKILKTGLGDRTAKEIARDVADATGSTVTQLRGHTFTLRKVKTPKRYL
jgi:RNA-binding protein